MPLPLGLWQIKAECVPLCVLSSVLGLSAGKQQHSPWNVGKMCVKVDAVVNKPHAEFLVVISHVFSLAPLAKFKEFKVLGSFEELCLFSPCVTPAPPAFSWWCLYFGELTAPERHWASQRPFLDTYSLLGDIRKVLILLSSTPSAVLNRFALTKTGTKILHIPEGVLLWLDVADGHTSWVKMFFHRQLVQISGNRVTARVQSLSATQAPQPGSFSQVQRSTPQQN